MVKLRFWLGTLVLVGVLAASTAAGALSSPIRSAQGASVVINEVQYDPPPTGFSESRYEWVELLNTGHEPVDLVGWQIADSRASDQIPDAELPPGEFLVVAAGEGFAELFPSFTGRIVTLEGNIGNGLGNSGDQVSLLDAAGDRVDGMSYGNDSGILDPSAPDVEAGHSLERVPAGADTDMADDWIDQSAPSPGKPAGDVRPTAVPTAAPPPTMAPGTAVLLNEYLPAPRDIDWDGDGEATAQDEWVELFNPGDAQLELRGWQLDDVADGGSSPHVLSEGTVIAPRGYLVIFRRESKIALNNGGDSIRLLRPGGAVADEHAYDRSAPDASFSRHEDGVGAWTDALPPSPGGSNTGGSPPPDPSPVPSATPGEGTPQPTPGPTDIVPSPGPNPTPESLFLPFLITEVLFDPPMPGPDAVNEWVELYNRTAEPASLAGWSIGDGVAWDALPDVAIPPLGYVVIAATSELAAVLEAGGAPVIAIADGRLGNGLANRGDVVRVRGPTGRVADAVSYGTNLEAFDPAVPIGPPGSSIERLPPDADTDTAEDWWIQPVPSPGQTGVRREGPPHVVVNELLPAPSRVDWDGNGVADHTDEWVELYNAAEYPVDLGGWRLVEGEEDGDSGGWYYRLPDGWVVPPLGFRVLYRSESGLILGNDGDTVHLVRDDTVTADAVSWAHSPGYDRSWSRTADGAGEWTDEYAVTPGEPNRPRPPETDGNTDSDSDARRSREPAPDPAARIATLTDLRALPAGSRVLVQGRITAPPGVFGDRVAYLGNAEGGVQLYLKGEGQLPNLAEGERSAARGRLKDYHGEREVVLDDPADLWMESPSAPTGPTDIVHPVDVPTGAFGESVEGRLVGVRGRVTRWQGSSLWLDDGTGEVRVLVRRATGIRRPWVERGQWLTVVGIAGQYAERAPWEGGYRLMPRYAADFGAADGRLPARLPETGRVADVDTFSHGCRGQRCDAPIPDLRDARGVGATYGFRPNTYAMVCEDGLMRHVDARLSCGRLRRP